MQDSKRIKCSTEDAATALVGISTKSVPAYALPHSARPLVTHSLVLSDKPDENAWELESVHANSITNNYNKLYMLGTDEIYEFLRDVDPMDVYRHTCKNVTKRVVEILHYGNTAKLGLPLIQKRNKCRLEIAFDSTITRMVYLKYRLIGITRVEADGTPGFAILTGVYAVDQELRAAGFHASAEKAMREMVATLIKHSMPVSMIHPMGHELFPFNQFSLIKNTIERGNLEEAMKQTENFSEENKQKVDELFSQLQ